MIVAYEGLQASGKTSIAKSVIECNKLENVFGILYNSFTDKKPDFHDNGLCNSAFEDVAQADLLRTVPIGCDYLVFDRSIISGWVYHQYKLDHGMKGDITMDDSYIPFWLAAMHNGINGPLVIFYLEITASIAHKRIKQDAQKRPDRVFFDVTEQYARFWHKYEQTIKNMEILFIKRQNITPDDLYKCINEFSYVSEIVCPNQ